MKNMVVYGSRRPALFIESAIKKAALGGTRLPLPNSPLCCRGQQWARDGNGSVLRFRWNQNRAQKVV